MQETAIINGANVSSNIESNTTMLVVGERAGSKLDRAQKQGIAIVSDEDFMAIVGSHVVHKEK
ncbi:hypothetical protein MFLO_13353 [Listeria floridensis FSL S10-1187]|uniref:BRCT domain-containing protein n=1 Tax=Listeria floridensis FSL S10-1187 TaxID=1265817 RepID=A0ABN0RCR3_9LIST|nr:BRCT domain-containing protein [Listeria floridensis]EUJ27448.1 hypothetical protein MFLO_13353 [Listeria floridensis FSL S10-1187]